MPPFVPRWSGRTTGLLSVAMTMLLHNLLPIIAGRVKKSLDVDDRTDDSAFGADDVVYLGASSETTFSDDRNKKYRCRTSSYTLRDPGARFGLA